MSMKRIKIIPIILALAVVISANPYFTGTVMAEENAERAEGGAGEDMVEENISEENPAEKKLSEEITDEETGTVENTEENNNLTDDKEAKEEGEELILAENNENKQIQNEQIQNEQAQIEQARSALAQITQDHPIMALVYLSDEYPVRQEASYDSDTTVTVYSGQQVQIQDVFKDENNEAWAGVALYCRGELYQGYIPRSYLACSDEQFLQWEATYISQSNTGQRVGRMSFARQATYADIEQFPDSYKEALTALKQAHPNWTFVKMNTNLDWNAVLTEELKDGRSLIESVFPAYMQDGLYSQNWAYATRDALAYYMDPRNGLNESTIFQYELLTYNETYHTEAAVQSFLNNTFMAGNAPKTSMSYAQAFWTSGSELKVSPFHLASRAYQEQGNGTSPLISGTYPGYEGYYNFFNIGASGNTDKAVYESGLTKARQEGWTDGYKSISGGAKIISQNYILKGQDTLYLQKFDVDGSYDGLYWHQYMQNICAPSSEAQNIKRLYSNANSLDNTFVFKIPVYNDMPAAACAMPTASYNVSLTPPAGYTDANIYLDGVGYGATVQNGQYTVNAGGSNVKTAIMYQYNEAGVPVGMYVWTLQYNNGRYVATAVPELENLLSYHGFSIRITGKSGIRFKTGIAADLRSRLISAGVAGYTLKEYGTLVMNNANRSQYPMIKGGEKVLGGMSYGKNASGALEDVIYETVSGRHRFTSVLVGLPASQYKVDYAFRGYITLWKDGKEITLYGPIVWKNIYSMAGQVVSGGQYENGSEADLFLRQLIADADGV